MKIRRRTVALVALLGASLAMQACRPPAPPSGTYNVDVVTFSLSSGNSNSAGLVPHIWIDTNPKMSGLSGGSVKTSKPYGVGFDYTDNAQAFAAAELTSVKVIYSDGTIDPGSSALKVPLRISARSYETVNSMNGGRIVKAKTRIISHRIPGVVGRDESFRLQIEGRFVKLDGGSEPFTIDHHYDIKIERSTKSASEVLQDK